MYFASSIIKRLSAAALLCFAASASAQDCSPNALVITQVLVSSTADSAVYQLIANNTGNYAVEVGDTNFEILTSARGDASVNSFHGITQVDSISYKYNYDIPAGAVDTSAGYTVQGTPTETMLEQDPICIYPTTDYIASQLISGYSYPSSEMVTIVALLYVSGGRADSTVGADPSTINYDRIVAELFYEGVRIFDFNATNFRDASPNGTVAFDAIFFTYGEQTLSLRVNQMFVNFTINVSNDRPSTPLPTTTVSATPVPTSSPTAIPDPTSTIPSTGCNVDVSAARRQGDGSSWISGENYNYIFDVTVNNVGTCGVVDLGVDIGLSADCRITNSWNLQATSETTLIVGYGNLLASGSVFTSAGFIVECSSSTEPTPTINIYGTNCEDGCSSTTTSAPTDTPTSDPTSAPTTTPTSAPTSAPQCPGAAEVYLAISFSSYNGSYGFTTDSGGPAEAAAFALQSCNGPANTIVNVGCTSYLIVENSCGALAISTKTDTPYPVNNYLAGVGSGDTREIAEQKALSNCNCRVSGLSGVTCSIADSGCTF